MKEGRKKQRIPTLHSSSLYTAYISVYWKTIQNKLPFHSSAKALKLLVIPYSAVWSFLFLQNYAEWEKRRALLLPLLFFCHFMDRICGMHFYFTKYPFFTGFWCVIGLKLAKMHCISEQCNQVWRLCDPVWAHCNTLCGYFVLAAYSQQKKYFCSDKIQ